MFGNVTVLAGFHVTEKYRDISMQHTCSRQAAWDSQRGAVCRECTAGVDCWGRCTASEQRGNIFGIFFLNAKTRLCYVCQVHSTAAAGFRGSRV